jgi:hypothetical protein
MKLRWGRKGYLASVICPVFEHVYDIGRRRLGVVEHDVHGRAVDVGRDAEVEIGLPCRRKMRTSPRW